MSRNHIIWKSKHNTLRKIANTSRQELCRRLHIFRICKACWEAGGWHFKTLVWNMVSWTAGEKQIQHFWWMETSYMIKLLEQMSCFRSVTCSTQHSTVDAWNTQMSLLSDQTRIWSISMCITNFSQYNSDQKTGTHLKQINKEYQGNAYFWIPSPEQFDTIYQATNYSISQNSPYKLNSQTYKLFLTLYSI